MTTRVLETIRPIVLNADLTNSSNLGTVRAANFGGHGGSLPRRASF
jgi:hypothetical protein